MTDSHACTDVIAVKNPCVTVFVKYMHCITNRPIVKAHNLPYVQNAGQNGGRKLENGDIDLQAMTRRGSEVAYTCSDTFGHDRAGPNTSFCVSHLLPLGLKT